MISGLRVSPERPQRKEEKVVGAGEVDEGVGAGHMETQTVGESER